MTTLAPSPPTSLSHIPALRLGQPYTSLDATVLNKLGDNTPLAEMSLVNPGLIRRDLRRLGEARQALAAFSTEDLMAAIERAADLFMEGDLSLDIFGEAEPIGGADEEDIDPPRQSPQEYVEALSATTGLPYALCRANMGKVEKGMRNIRTIFAGLSRSLDPAVLDAGSGEHHGVPVSFYATTDALGVVLPSNSPGVNTLWLPAIAMKIPVLLKPGREDPWTPARILSALVEAGCPRQAFGFYPTDHEGAETILQGCGRAIVFGGDATVERYAQYPHIQTHGTGRSKIILGEDCVDRWEDYLDVMVASIATNGGRSCINASCIITPRYGDAIADALAQRLAEVEPLPLEANTATLAGFANPKMADWIDGVLEQGLAEEGAEDVTARHRPGSRRVERHGQTYLLPVITRCQDFKHPLANTEFLFPYASVVEMSQRDVLSTIGFTLVVTALTEDQQFIGELLACRDVDRLNIGPVPTCVVHWDQPHEGNLFDFLYARRALQTAA